MWSILGLVPVYIATLLKGRFCPFVHRKGINWCVAFCIQCNFCVMSFLGIFWDLVVVVTKSLHVQYLYADKCVLLLMHIHSVISYGH